MLFNLLEGETTSFTSFIPIIIIIVLVVAFIVWSYISQKKKQKNFNETINAVRPGSKVKTIGGIVGEVVEVNDEENTFVLKTGDSEGNCSYMKFDKQAIYQTDAKPEPAAPAKEVAPAENAGSEAPAEPFEESAPETSDGAEETAAEEKKSEEENK